MPRDRLSPEKRLIKKIKNKEEGLCRRRDELNNFKRQWRAEQKAVSPTDKRAIHDLIQKDVASHT